MITLLIASLAVLTLEPREYTAAEFKSLVAGRSDLVVRSADREHPAVVTGGRRLAGWTVGTDGVWRVTLPEVRSGKWQFSQLFVNGARRYRPRVPAQGWYEAIAPTRVCRDEKSAAFGVGGFTYGGDVLDPNWANRSDLEIQMLFQWNGARMRVREIDAAAHEVILSAVHPSVAPFHSPAKRRFAVENVKEAFGRPGEWYLDRPSGVLSYTPRAGETPETCVVEVPEAEGLLVLEGARNLVFQNVVFRLDNRNTPTDRSVFTPQGEIGVGAAVEVRNGSHVSFEGCVFANLGAWALTFDDRCADCRVSACVIADAGAGGIRIGSKDRAAERIVVEDTEICELGRRDPGAPGIMAIQSAYGRFVRNHIHHFYYTGISVGWGWRVEETPLSHHNEIAHNHIHDLGLGMLSDLGQIYLLCRQPGTRVHHNYLHDITHFAYGSTGIYPDECSAHLEIDHNFVRNSGRSFHSNMVCDLSVHDNVFVDGDLFQWDFSSNIGEEGPYLRLYRNTFVWNGGRLAHRGISFKASPEERKNFNVPFWQGLDLHDNVYWRRDGVAATFPAADIRADTAPKLTLAAFQAASGQERGTVFRDPGELDPLAVCGETGVDPAVKRAVWPLPPMPRPFGHDERIVVRRASREIRMNDGIATFLGKLKAGEEVTVAYFGGSITEGSAYRPVFTDWLRAQYPRAKVNEVNAGIGGTGSNLGVYRLASDVLVHRPDLVFVEFALNDHDKSSVDPTRIGADVEAIVRGIWRADPTTDIVFLYTVSRALAKDFGRGILTREAAIYDTVADRYRLPTVNFAPQVMALERAGKLVWTLGVAPTAVPKEDSDYDRKVGAEMTEKGRLVFSNDGVHPRAEGGALYVATLTNFFSQTMPEPYAWNRPNLVAAAPFAEDPCLSPTALELRPAWLRGTWREVKADDAPYGGFLPRTGSMWLAERPGDRLEFTFDGAEAALYALYGPSGARLRVWVDGVRQPDRDLFDRYCTYWRLMRVPLFRGARGRHRVVLEIADEQPDRQKAKVFRKLTDEQMRKIGFDGHRAAIGRLFIDGRLP